MRSLEESSQRWQKVEQEASSVANLQASVRTGGDLSICVSGLRSVCWKVFLLFRSVDKHLWAAVTDDSRSAYASLKDHFLRFIEHPEQLASTVDPLSDDENSSWNTLRQDEELRAEILQDVERCMPDEPYFRNYETQKMLLDILFIYCKINQDIGYRQGMHELLAPVLWVVQKDALTPLDLMESMSADDSRKPMMNMLNASFVEHDSFTLFSLMMRTAKSFYELSEPKKIHDDQQGSFPIVERSKRIHEVLLAQLDPELASHLTQIEILPQIFLIRWIRLLFGREFPFESLLSLWDRLFAEDPDLELVDLICVSMLLRIRWQLLDADYSVALTLLLNYPPPELPQGPETFVEDALYLRDNLNMSSGAKIITKYSGKAPILSLSTSRPTIPAGQVKPNSAEQKFSRRRSPLPSPARFLQHQGGVEALLHGAAKGVFERGERLGINQAVRDAVSEVKKNMHNRSPGPSELSRTASGSTRWSLDEGRALPFVGKSMAALEARNKELARLMGEALEDLRKFPEPIGSTAATSESAAIEKLQVIQLCLEDSNLPLPSDSSSDPITPKIAGKKEQQADMLQMNDAAKIFQAPSTVDMARFPEGNSLELSTSLPMLPDHESMIPTYHVDESSPIKLKSSLTESLGVAAEDLTTAEQPAAIMATRSTLAQSSFAWMLEPDEQSTSSGSSLSPKGPAPFSPSGRKLTMNATREKTAFLFGDEVDDTGMDTGKADRHVESRDGLNLAAMNKGGAQ